MSGNISFESESQFEAYDRELDCDQDFDGATQNNLVVGNMHMDIAEP